MSISSPDPALSLDTHAKSRAAQAAHTEQLLRAADAADGEQRDELLDAAVVAGVPLARTLARRFRGRGVDDDDLEQVAFEFLIRAVQNYRPTDGSDFRSYAVPTIRGGLRHHFRDNAWAVKLPRRLQETQARVNQVESGLAVDLGHWPSHAEVAQEIGVDVAEVSEAEQARGCFRPLSLDAPITGDRPDLNWLQLVADPNDTFALVDQVESLLPVVESLTDRDRLVFRRRFVDHHSQAQIGAEVGISQMQVSRLLRSIMGRLQLALTA
ncbi:sigma-70 family RNA polymerase sigma factor [Kribbella sp. NPDC004875]|uniref:sigma-70 family RNA polymerase sigma factor n=1 Tax=Kribbella sp. NPDC004875 TaxID=3364107 RepID=UPI0036B8548A